MEPPEPDLQLVDLVFKSWSCLTLNQAENQWAGQAFQSLSTVPRPAAFLGAAATRVLVKATIPLLTEIATKRALLDFEW